MLVLKGRSALLPVTIVALPYAEWQMLKLETPGRLTEPMLELWLVSLPTNTCKSIFRKRHN